MYNLKLRIKVRSNHEEAQRLPLLDRPDLSTSKTSDLVGPLDGVYHRVCILPAMIIAGSEYNRIAESSFQTRLDCCAYDGSSTLLISLILPPHKRAARSAIRFLTLDLDTASRVPRVTRQHFGPPAVPKGESSLASSTPATPSLSSSTSSYQDYSQGPYTRTGSSTSITSPHGVSASKLKSLIGDDYVPSRPSPSPSGDGDQYARSNSSGFNTPSEGRGSPTHQHSRGLTDAELLSASVLSKQPVFFDKLSESMREFPRPDDYQPEPGVPQTVKLDEVLARETSHAPRATRVRRSLASSHHPDFEDDYDELSQENKLHDDKKSDNGQDKSDPSLTGFAKAVESNGSESTASTDSNPHEASNGMTEHQKEASGEPKSNDQGPQETSPTESAPPAADLSSSHLNGSQLANGHDTMYASQMTVDTATTEESDMQSSHRLDSSSASLNDSLLNSRARMSEADLAASSGYATPSSSSSSYSAQHTTPRDPREGAEYIANEIELNTFGAEATSLALNRPSVSSGESLETLVGFANGAILKFDPKAVREATEAEKLKKQEEAHSKKHDDSNSKKKDVPTNKKTFNYDHPMVDGTVRKLAWLTTNQFMATFSDGFIYLFQSQCEDDPDFTKDAHNPRLSRLKKASTPSSVPSAIPPTITSSPHAAANANSKEAQAAQGKKSTTSSSAKPKKPTIINDDMPIPQDGWVADSMWLRVQKTGGKPLNPIAMWSISPGVPVTDYAISPDLSMLAATSKDGFLRIYSMNTYKLLVLFKSYFGGFTCFSWSPDSKYIVTGGEDDLISLWSIEDKQLVARGEGHSSWIGRITFDAHRCSSGSYYRFASVGQDSKLAIWEFSADTLVLPTLSLQKRRKRARSSSVAGQTLSVAPTTHGFLMTFEIEDKGDEPPVVVAPPPRDQTCKLEPVVIQRVTTSPCSDVQFIGADLLFVAGWAGQCAFFLLESHSLHGHNGLRHLPMPKESTNLLVDEINSKLATSSANPKYAHATSSGSLSTDNATGQPFVI